MNGQHSLDPARIRSVRARFARLVDRYETSVAFLVVAWTVAFLVRSRLAQTDRLSDVVNEALLSLLFVVPIMLIAWGRSRSPIDGSSSGCWGRTIGAE